jgi:hypothetical protein
MSPPSESKDRLAVLFGSLAEQVEEMTDEQILDEAVSAGVDVKAEADRIRGVLLGAVVTAKKARLTEAMAEHRRNVSALTHRSARIPTAPSERRALLMSSLERRPQVKDGITLQHRDFASFSDADVEILLKQLDVLGLLDDDPESES